MHIGVFSFPPAVLAVFAYDLQYKTGCFCLSLLGLLVVVVGCFLCCCFGVLLL